MLPRTSRSTLFPYTTLFRSAPGTGCSSVCGATRLGASKVFPAFRSVPVRTSAFVTLDGVTPCHSTSSSRRSEEHTSELQSRRDLVCRLLLEKKKSVDIIERH